MQVLSPLHTYIYFLLQKEKNALKEGTEISHHNRFFVLPLGSGGYNYKSILEPIDGSTDIWARIVFPSTKGYGPYERIRDPPHTKGRNSFFFSFFFVASYLDILSGKILFLLQTRAVAKGRLLQKKKFRRSVTSFREHLRT